MCLLSFVTNVLETNQSTNQPTKCAARTVNQEMDSAFLERQRQEANAEQLFGFDGDDNDDNDEAQAREQAQQQLSQVSQQRCFLLTSKHMRVVLSFHVCHCHLLIQSTICNGSIEGVRTGSYIHITFVILIYTSSRSGLKTARTAVGTLTPAS
jgi:hypothetical protein